MSLNWPNIEQKQVAPCGLCLVSKPREICIYLLFTIPLPSLPMVPSSNFGLLTRLWTPRTASSSKRKTKINSRVEYIKTFLSSETSCKGWKLNSEAGFGFVEPDGLLRLLDQVLNQLTIQPEAMWPIVWHNPVCKACDTVLAGIGCEVPEPGCLHHLLKY